MKGSEAVTRVSQFLADQMPGDEFARWTEAELFSAFQYALQNVAAADPTIFNGLVTVTLQEGSAQTLPAQCNRLTDTVDNLRPVSRIAQRLVRRRAVCPPNANAPYSPSSYSYDPDRSQNIMYISPPVPASAAGKTIQVVCNLNPKPLSLDEDVPLSGPAESAILDLMIFYICSGENESATHADTAEKHFAAAVKFLGMDDANNDRADRRKREILRNGVE